MSNSPQDDQQNENGLETGSDANSDRRGEVIGAVADDTNEAELSGSSSDETTPPTPPADGSAPEANGQTTEAEADQSTAPSSSEQGSPSEEGAVQQEGSSGGGAGGSESAPQGLDDGQPLIGFASPESRESNPPPSEGAAFSSEGAPETSGFDGPAEGDGPFDGGAEGDGGFGGGSESDGETGGEPLFDDAPEGAAMVGPDAVVRSYQFIGGNEDDRLAQSFGSIGDIDGDGRDDFIVGAPYYDANGLPSVGAVYIVTSRSIAAADAADGETDGIVNLDNIDRSDGAYRIVGQFQNDWLGWDVSSAGDVDGDGLQDILIGVPRGDGPVPNSGDTYLLSTANLGAADAADGNLDGEIQAENIASIADSYMFVGGPGHQVLGTAVSSAGDFDNDGLDDLVIGVPQSVLSMVGSATVPGETFVVSASRLHDADAADGTVDGVIDIDNVPLSGSSYRFIGSEAGDDLGYAVGAAGDVDGDGYDDFLIGAHTADAGGTDSGASYLVSGQHIQDLDLADGTADGIINVDEIGTHGTGSYRFVGTEAMDRSGISVATAGDITGDGRSDILIGSQVADDGGINAGEVYLIDARDLVFIDLLDSALDGDIDLDNVNIGPNSYRFIGEIPQNAAGFSVSSAGDVDGDGHDDILIGAPRPAGGGEHGGKVYLIDADELANADAADGAVDGNIQLKYVHDLGTSYEFRGTDPGDRAGYRVESAGDVDGDGLDDLMIGALTADSSGTGSDTGEMFLVRAKDLEKADEADGSDDGIIYLDLVNEQNDILPQTEINSSYKFIGTEDGDLSGFSVSGIGDFDGDGQSDLLIAAMRADGSETDAGEMYIISGGALAAADAADGTIDRIIDLDNINEQDGSYQILGASQGDQSNMDLVARLIDNNQFVTGIDDLEGDGRNEILIGARYADDGGLNSGAAYLLTSANIDAIDGLDGSLDGVVDLSNAQGLTGNYRFVGEDPGDLAGASVANAGDIDGDGKGDLLIAAPSTDEVGDVNTGSVYVVTAQRLSSADDLDGSSDGVIDLANVAGEYNSYEIHGGADGIQAGLTVSGVGDFDEDGLGDILIGAPGLAPHGAAFLVSFQDLNPADATDGIIDGKVSLKAVLDQSNSYMIIGNDADEIIGSVVAGAGDTDGDGKGDIIIGGPRTLSSSSTTDPIGDVYLITIEALETTTPSTDGVEISDLVGLHESYRFTLDDPADVTHISVDGVGDVDGDERNDLLIGARSVDGDGNSNSGEIYLVTADSMAAADAADGFLDGNINLDNTAGLDGSYRFIGPEGSDFAGHTISLAGDVDGDGLTDLLIGVPGADQDNGDVNSGETFLVLAKHLFAADLADGTLDGIIRLDNTLLCFARGTRIETVNGPVPVEDLRVGDFIVTKDAGLQPLRWVRSQIVEGRGANAPVCIREGVLGNSRDLWVSPQHRMLLSSYEADLMYGSEEVLAAAKHLCTEDKIEVQECEEVEYFHLLLDRHHIVFAENCPTESFFPGQESLRILGENTIAELNHKFPDMMQQVVDGTYKTARLCLTATEAKLLFRHGMMGDPPTPSMSAGPEFRLSA